MDLENQSNDFNSKLIRMFKKNKNFFYFVNAVVLAVFILLFFSLPLLFPKVSLRVFNGYEDFAVPYNSEIVDGLIKKRVVWIDVVEISELKDGDLVAIEDEFGTIWIEEIVTIDSINNQVISTFDGITVDRADFDAVAGKYVRQANIFGIFYYFVSSPLGFGLMSLAFGGSILIGYHGFVKDIRSFIKKFKDNYADEEKITA